MNRRDFIATALTTMGCVTVPAGIQFLAEQLPPVTEDTKLYDWSTSSADRPPYYPDSRVYLDGKDVSEVYWIRKAQAGKDGWIEYQVMESVEHETMTDAGEATISGEFLTRTDRKRPLYEIRNNWTGQWELMNAEWRRTHKYQIFDPDRLGPDGKLLPKYGEERVKTETIRGEVRVWLKETN